MKYIKGCDGGSEYGFYFYYCLVSFSYQITKTLTFLYRIPIINFDLDRTTCLFQPSSSAATMHFLTTLSLCALALAASALPASDVADIDKRGQSVLGDWPGSSSQYADGSGVFIKSYDCDDQCCTDLFGISSMEVAQDWVKSNVEVDCATTQDCVSGQINATQQCTSWTLGGSFDASWTIVMDIFSVVPSLQASYTKQQCSSASSTTTCQWNDGKCHAIWTSNTALVVNGYIDRRCKNHQTLWRKDLTITLPNTVTRLGCAATCDMASYPLAVPSVGN